MTKLPLRGVAWLTGESPPVPALPRAWIRYGPGEQLRCPLCARRVGDVSLGTVAFIRRASSAATAPSVVQQCPRDTCGEKYELQTLLVGQAEAAA